MNRLHYLERLANRYFITRHGPSLANEQGLTASHVDHALEGYGPTEPGRGQVAALDAATRILSTDFRRARETAELAHARLGCGTELRFDRRLRERDFGEFELTTDKNYHRIWRQDEAGVESGWCGVEGPGQVMARITSLTVDCESRSRG